MNLFKKLFCPTSISEIDNNDRRKDIMPIEEKFVISEDMLVLYEFINIFRHSNEKLLRDIFYYEFAINEDLKSFWLFIKTIVDDISIQTFHFCSLTHNIFSDIEECLESLKNKWGDTIYSTILNDMRAAIEEHSKKEAIEAQQKKEKQQALKKQLELKIQEKDNAVQI